MAKKIYYGQFEVMIKKVPTIIDAIWVEGNKHITSKRVKYHDFKPIEYKEIGKTQEKSSQNTW